MEKRFRIRTDCAKRRISPGDNEVCMKTSNRSQLSTQDQQNMVRDCRLVQLLKNSKLGCWLSEICADTVALQLLTAGLFLLFVWLLAELHVVLPCLLLCGCLCDEPLRRAVNTAWNWITASSLTLHGRSSHDNRPQIVLVHNFQHWRVTELLI